MLSKTILATAVLSVLVVGAEAAASDGGLIVSRDEWDRTTTIVVPSQHGRLDWDDVFRGLARAGRFDDQALSEEFDGRGLDLTRRRSRLAIRALSAAAPDVRMRVVEHPVTAEPALRIRLDRGDARGKVRRLKALIRERFAADRELYGLRLDDEWDEQPVDRPLVVLVHGYGDSPRSLDGLHGELVEQGFSCATFAYPNDGPLSEAAEFLAAELHDFQEEHPDRKIAAVTHSMGGLVVRAVIEDPELDPGNVTRLIMLCPPNHGSPWAELPGGLECWEYLRREERGSLDEAFNASITDGLNEARTDLKPGSRFLHELNARERNPNVNYSLILGTGAPFTQDEVGRLHERVARSLADDRTGRFFMPRVDGLFAGLEEVALGRGDGVVSITSGQLEGVRDIALLPMHHGDVTGELSSPAQRLLLDAIVERLDGQVPRDDPEARSTAKPPRRGY